MEGMSNVTEKMAMPNEGQSVKESSKIEITQDVQTEKSEQETHRVNTRKDAYISSKEQEIIGIYNIGKDKDGKAIIENSSFQFSVFWQKLTRFNWHSFTFLAD